MKIIKKSMIISLLICLMMQIVYAVDINFTSYTITTSADGADTVYAIDLDSDGDMDVLSGSQEDGEIIWYENDGSESFTRHIIPSTYGFKTSVFAIDIDGDNDIDVLSVGGSTLAWFENDGSESFTEYIITQSISPYLKQVYAIDIDSDGDIDIVSAGGDKVAWYENDGSESFTEHIITILAINVRSVYAIDLDSDGDIDMLSANQNDFKIAWYENDGSENFTMRWVSPSIVGTVRFVFAIDMDDDNDIDVVFADYGNDRVGWYENDGSESFTLRSITFSADGVVEVYAIDLDSDGDIDVLSASINDDKIAWYENDGSESFTTHIITTSIDQAMSVFAIDIDGDNDIDVLSASYFDDRIAWYENNLSITTCFDSDGIDYFNKGYIIEEFGTFWDYCVKNITGNMTDQRLGEYKCVDGSMDVDIIDCEDYGTGWSCYDGRCVTPENQRPTFIPDYSTSYYKIGTTSYYTNLFYTTTDVFYDVNVVDPEDDSIYVAVDCDISFGPPWVLDWSPPHTWDTEHTPCTYSSPGIYTARVYVSDYAHLPPMWNDYVTYYDVQIVIEAVDCVDADGGQDEFTASYVQKGFDYFRDAVFASDKIKEYYCDDFDVAQYIVITCDYGIDSFSCPDGIGGNCAKCLTYTQVCEEYIDTGFDYLTFGYIIENSVRYDDECISLDNLTEWECVGDNRNSTVKDCRDYGMYWSCGNGYCSEYAPSCSDSDGGLVYNIKGYVDYNNTIFWDGCVGATDVVAEVFCNSTTGAIDTYLKDCGDYGPEYECFDGRCTLESIDCTDSDGIDYFNKGYITVDNITSWDVCMAVNEMPEWENFLWEQICGGLGGDAIEKDCDDYGPLYMCYNGACIERPTNCTDSDGVDYWTSGYVTHIPTGVTYPDLCVNNRVTEYICSGENVDAVTYDCEIWDEVCLDGRCITVADCIDSDGGVNYFLKGTVTTPSQTFTDVCLIVQGNPNYVTEYYCEDDGGVGLIANRRCEYECYDGACVSITPTDPTAADIDSYWYRDENGTLHFDGERCIEEGWNSMMMCAGWKYSLKQVATGTSWIFSGIHILYFVVFLLVIIIVGPLLVEFFKKKY